MKHKAEGATLLAAMLIFGTVLPSHAQVLYGSIVGTVEDPSGSVVPRAVVTVINKQTGGVRTSAADEAGRFTILTVPAGTYDLKVTSPGFRQLTKTDIEVAINTVSRTDVKLEVGQTEPLPPDFGPDCIVVFYDSTGTCIETWITGVADANCMIRYINNPEKNAVTDPAHIAVSP